MPKLIRLYIVSVLIGFGVSALFTAFLIGFDVVGLRRLVAGEEGMLAVFLLWFFNGIVFAGVQFGFAIMRMAEKPDGPRGGNRAPVTRPRPTLEPARAHAEAKAPTRR